ncbi:MAG: hypothetical protein Q9175_002625 [Cornicularia normoerica]
MPASANEAVGSCVSSKMVERTMQSSSHNNPASRNCVNMTSDGEGGDRDHEEMIDLVEEVEEDGDSEDRDQVTETEVAESEQGKQPVFHHEIYDRLVNLMSRQGTYTCEPPDHGVDSMDITSFHPDQRDWGSARAHRAPILTLWSEPPRSAPTYPIGCLLFNGRLILDYAGNPIRAFRNLPLTISSAVKGFRLETWIRQDIHRLHIDDILARLRTRNTPNGRQPLHKRGDFTDRAHFFRQKAGLVTFRPRNNALRLASRRYMDSLRTAAQKASNLATDQDLTPDQLATLKEISKTGHTNAVAGPSADASVSAPAPAPAPALSATPTSPPARRHRQFPALQPAPATPPTPGPSQILPDSRDDVPETCKESYILIDALEETVEHFKKLTEQKPKRTNTAESYSTQWNALQAQFAPIWKSQRSAEETPLLFKLCAWTGGIGCWDDDWRTKVGGEKRDREGKKFGEYMDATQEGTAYLGPDGTWRSVRDTWCNSHANPTEGRRDRRDSTNEGVSAEDSEEGAREGSREISEKNLEEVPEEGSDDAYDDTR